MEQVLKNRMWGFIVGILVVANVATLAGFWFLKLHNDNPTTIQPSAPANNNASKFIITQLSLDAAQQQTYMKLVTEHRKNVNQIQEHLHLAKDEFFNSVSDDKISQARLDTLASAIGNCERKIDMLTYQHFKQVRALCNAEQKEKFDNIIKQVMRMMGPAGGRPQGPPPPRDGSQGGFQPPPPPDGQGPPPGGGQSPPPQ